VKVLEDDHGECIAVAQLALDWIVLNQLSKKRTEERVSRRLRGA
jgi:hypothetical protein